MLVSRSFFAFFMMIFFFENCFSQEGYKPYSYIPSNPLCPSCRTSPSNPTAPNAYLSEYGNSMAKNFGRFGNTAVDNYTGLPAISIPIYEINVRGFSMPLVLSYNASGIKVNQDASHFGLGWKIEGIPSISRVVRGGDDFKNSLNGTDNITKYADNLTTTVNPCTLKNSCISVNDGSSVHSSINNEVDLQADIFSLNVGGSSYQFMLDHNRAANRQVILLSTEKITINLIYVTNCLVPSFEVFMPNGVKYYFGAPSATYSQQIYMPNSNYLEWMQLTKIEPGTPPVVSEEYIATKWLSRKIETPSSDLIELVYGINNNTNLITDNKNYIYNTLADLQNGIPNKIGSENITVAGIERLPHHIYFPTGSVVFDANSRLDLAGGAVSSIEISQLDDNGMGQVIPLHTKKKYVLDYDYFNAGVTLPVLEGRKYKRLKLVRLKEVDVKTGVAQPGYEFTYNESMTFGSAGGATLNLPAKNSCSFDHWGYYNHKNLSATEILPTKENVDVQGITVSFDGLDRNIDISYSQMGILTKMKYPTGGFTEYTYENNDYNSPSDPKKVVSGLRIKQVRTSDGDNDLNNDHYRTYSYFQTDALGNLTTNSSGVLMEDIMYTKVPNYTPVEWQNKGWPVIRSSQNILPVGTHSFGNIVGYSEVQVTEGLNGEIGKTMYKYHALPNSYFENFSGNFPSTSYYNYVYNNIEKITSGTFSNLMYVRNGLLKESTSYKKVGTDFKLVGKTENIYNNTNSNSTIALLSKTNIYKSGKYIETTAQVLNGGSYCTTTFYNCDEVELLQYKTPYLRIKLTSSKKTTYDPSDVTKFISTLTSYEYDNATHLQLKKVCVNPGEKGSICTEYSYPADYTRLTPTTNALMDMKSPNRHMHSAEVERVVKKDLLGDGVYKVMGANYTEYKWATTNTSPIVVAKTYQLETDIPLTETTNYSLSSTPGYFINAQTLWQTYDMIAIDNNYPATANETFTTYDEKGYCMSKVNEGNIPTSYMYGYYRSLLIAKVYNADRSQFAYAGFEGGTLADDWWPLANGNLVRWYDSPYWVIIPSKSYIYSGRQSVRIPKSTGSFMFGPTKDITPSQQTGKYKFSCYVRTDAVTNNMAAIVIHTKLAGDNTQTIYPNIPQAYITTPIPNTNGTWQYIEAIIDLGYIRQSQNIPDTTKLSLRAYPMSLDANNFIYIDELRIHPMDAEMVTYTYDVLNGPDSETDLNGYTKFIQYDGFGRIQCIKDNDGNIVRRYKYQYKQ
jgi:hypothetical protein